MPNWCSNSLTITSTKERIAHIAKELDNRDGKSFFDVFVQNAEEVGKSEEWYSYNLETYGCKWNCDANNWFIIEGITADEITITFDSPWGPPLSLYDEIHDEETDVSAEYFEPGMCFVGSYFNGEDSYYEYGGLTSDELYEELPAELIENWGIYDMIVEQEAYDQEIEEEDDDKK